MSDVGCPARGVRGATGGDELSSGLTRPQRATAGPAHRPQLAHPRSAHVARLHHHGQVVRGLFAPSSLGACSASDQGNWYHRPGCDTGTAKMGVTGGDYRCFSPPVPIPTQLSRERRSSIGHNDHHPVASLGQWVRWAGEQPSGGHPPTVVHGYVIDEIPGRVGIGGPEMIDRVPS